MNLSTRTQLSDPYLSRTGIPQAQRKRLDPVVYSKDSNLGSVSSELIEQYKKNGFLIIDNLFSDIEIQLFQKESNRLRETHQARNKASIITEPDSGEVRSIFEVHKLSNIFNKLVSDKRLAGLAEYILADQVYIHQSRLNYKPGFRGKEFYWHSDFETWHMEDGMPRMRALSMSITLTDNYEQNGPLMLIPGSHNDYVVCTGETPTDHFRKSLKKQEYGVPADADLKDLVDRYGIFSATGKPGSVIIFDCNIMHGSNGNITPYPRSNVFLVYNAISNRVVEPYCNQIPRPEWVASRESVNTLIPTEYKFKDYE